MEKYTILRVEGRPDWPRIPALRVEHYQWQQPLEIQMEARICHDGQRLHLQMRAWEPNIRAEHRDVLGMVCEDSCMEFFFRPDERDLRYFNFEINPNGVMFIGFGHGKADLLRLLPSPDQFSPHTERFSGGWIAEYQISTDFVRLFFPDFALEAGKRIRANLYKCGHRTAQPHYITWNPVISDAPSFHRPQDFGMMVLG